LVRTIRPDVTYARDIEEDPMLEEFAASLTSDRPAGRDFSERLPSPTSEAPVVVPIVAATTLEDQDPTNPTTLDSGALRTPPPRSIPWVDPTTLAASPGFPPVDTPASMDSNDSEVSDDTAKRRLDNFLSKVTRKRDPPLICEPPK
jgi:hypothetical protein